MKFVISLVFILVNAYVFAQEKGKESGDTLLVNAVSYSLGKIFESDKAIIKKLGRRKLLNEDDYKTALHFITANGDTLYVPISRQTLKPYMSTLREYGDKISVKGILFNKYKRKDGTQFWVVNEVKFDK